MGAMMANESASAFVQSVQEFTRRDRRRTIAFTVAAFVTWAAVLLASSVIINNAKKDLAKIRSETLLLQQTNQALKSNNTKLSADNTRLAALASLLNGPLSSVVEPRLYVQRVEGITDPRGKPVYDFILFLNVPEPRRSEIKAVEYIVNHPEKLNPVMHGGSAEASFAAAYRGTGCFVPVIVKVTPVRGNPFTTAFDECAAWADASASNSRVAAGK
jgi:hypothetical protein